MKRIFDIVISVLSLILMLPVFIIVTIAILILDPGPIFFKHLRIGKDGKEFRLIKFRSMTVLKSAENGLFEPGQTSRVTHIGRFLRKTKIDELPGLYNVLIGDMSIVGPRPEVRRWVDEYPARWGYVLKIRPGLTDKASILYRNEEKILRNSVCPENTYKNEILPRKLDLYEDYADNHNLFLDIRLIAETLFAVLWNVKDNE